MYDGFTTEQLDDSHHFYLGWLPQELRPGPKEFEAMWHLHPDSFHEMHGRLVKTPRWQQAYGRDYHYTQRTNEALPLHESLVPFLEWGRRAVDQRLNGVLLNWYDGEKGHYIGKHRDSIVSMIVGAPIVTLSLGEDRVFRLRP